MYGININYNLQSVCTLQSSIVLYKNIYRTIHDSLNAVKCIYFWNDNHTRCKTNLMYLHVPYIKLLYNFIQPFISIKISTQFSNDFWYTLFLKIQWNLLNILLLCSLCFLRNDKFTNHFCQSLIKVTEAKLKAYSHITLRFVWLRLAFVQTNLLF